MRTETLGQAVGSGKEKAQKEKAQIRASMFSFNRVRGELSCAAGAEGGRAEL